MNKVTCADCKMFNNIAQFLLAAVAQHMFRNGALSVPAEFDLTYKFLTTTLTCFSWDCTHFPADFSFDIVKVCWEIHVHLIHEVTPK